MKIRTVWVCVAVLLLGAGCGDSPDPISDIGVAEPDPRLRMLQGTKFELADLERGELLSFACQACHTLGAGQPDQIGPNLFGLFGRTAGKLPDFDYSDAIRSSGIVWGADTLDAWLAGPDDFLVGNNMVFAGYADPGDRLDLIGYLMWATGRLE